jgi:hypothetical protein
VSALVGLQIIVGMLIGLFLITVASPKLVQHAKFDPEYGACAVSFPSSSASIC